MFVPEIECRKKWCVDVCDVMWGLDLSVESWVHLTHLDGCRI